MPPASVALAALLAAAVLGFQSYQALIPNGMSVDRNGVSWPGVGHNVPQGGGARNVFGMAFAAAGRTWTTALCQADSDGDGFTNGNELGDPDCVWTVGATPARTTAITHPGFADSFPSANATTELTDLPTEMPMTTTTAAPTTTTAAPTTTVQPVVLLVALVVLDGSIDFSAFADSSSNTAVSAQARDAIAQDLSSALGVVRRFIVIVSVVLGSLDVTYRVEVPGDEAVGLGATALAAIQTTVTTGSEVLVPSSFNTTAAIIANVTSETGVIFASTNNTVVSTPDVAEQLGNLVPEPTVAALPGGAIALIVVLSVAGFLIFAVVVVLVIRNQKTTSQTTPMEPIAEMTRTGDAV